MSATIRAPLLLGRGNVDPDVTRPGRVVVPASQLALRTLAGTAILRDPRVEAGRQNLRQVDLTRPVDDSLVATATFTTADTGLSLETPFGGLAFENGIFVSFRSGHAQHFRGEAHLNALRLLEVSPSMGKIRSEALRIEFFFDGRQWEYVADYVRQHVPGVIVAVGEVKRDAQDLNDPEYVLKLALVQEILRRCGIAFELMFEDTMFETWIHRRNVKRFCMRRFAHVSRRHFDRLDAFAAKHGQMAAWGRLVEAIDPWEAQAEAVLQALLVRDRIALDLRRRIHGDTGVLIK